MPLGVFIFRPSCATCGYVEGRRSAGFVVCTPGVRTVRMKGLGLPSPLWSEDGVPVSMSGLVCWPGPVLLFPFQGLCEPLESFSLPSTFPRP